MRTAAVEKGPPTRQSKDEIPSVLSLGSQDKGKTDYASIGIFAVVLILLIGAGVYFTLNMDRGVLSQPLDKLSKLTEDVSRYGKAILTSFKNRAGPKARKPDPQKSMCAKGTTIIRPTNRKKP